MKVVRVPENDLRPDLAQMGGCDRLDRPLRAHRHEDGRIDDSVPGRELSSAGGSRRVGCQ